MAESPTSPSHASEPETHEPTDSPGTGPIEMRPLPLDTVTPQLTLRALLTGMILGALLSICNVYTGLKIGWSTNMSITGILLAYAAWAGIRAASANRVKPFTILENNINQASCSAAAAVSSAGLVAPIPALTLITGERFTWPVLILWVFAVCLVGITVATGLRRQMIIVDRLPFPSGIACAATLKEIYGRGSEAMKRVAMMGVAAVVAGVTKVGQIVAWLKSDYGIPGLMVGGEPAARYTLSVEPNLLMVGVGGLIGFRAAASLMLGAVLAWGVIAPRIVENGSAGLRSSETLLALPASVVLEVRDRVEYEPGRQRLRHAGPMSEERYAKYAAMSDDAHYREALLKLKLESNHRFTGGPAPTDYTTTRAARRSVEVPTWPEGFVIPASLATAVRHDMAGKRLTSWGPLGEGTRDGLIAAVEEFAGHHPEQRDACDELIAAARGLRARGAESSPLAGFRPTDTLVGRVEVMEAGAFIRAKGLLSDDDLKTLQVGVTDVDVLATLSSLKEGSGFAGPTPNFTDVLEWLLWPGVTLMVVSSLVAFSFSWRAIVRSFRGSKKGGNSAAVPVADTGEVTKQWFVFGLGVALVFAVTLQMLFFSIAWYAAVLGVLLSFVLAIVASRVSGETNTTPVGAMGKVTQLVFGLLVPANPAANLMTANVTGGAASQCADLMHDFKCGHLLVQRHGKQAIGQIGGALAGSILGTLFYLILIPDPKAMLFTEEWPAPAVATWKAVADLFAIGIEALPPGTPMAIAIAAILGVILPVLDRTAPKKAKAWIPSASALGLAFVINGRNSISMFIGAMLALIVARLFPRWSERFVVTICAGLVAGESLTGAGDAVRLVLMGGAGH